jgi:hypothetical protein
LLHGIQTAQNGTVLSGKIAITYWLLALVDGTTATGVYAACISVVSLANPLNMGLSNILTPRAVLALKEGGGARLRRQAIQDSLLLEHFQAKWIPVRVKKMRYNNVLEVLSDPAESENALVV